MTTGKQDSATVRIEYHVTDLKDGTIHVLDAPPPPSSEERLVKRRAVRTVEP